MMSSDEIDTRTRILMATCVLLERSEGADVRKGAGKGVRMADIAKKAGISRQAVYLHFPARADLLIAATRYIDEIKNINQRLAPSRAATTGRARLSAFVEAWGNYIPEIYGVSRAILAMAATDSEAKAAWTKRMQDMREGCEAAVNALDRDGDLSPDHSPLQATDILWTLLSVRTWEHYTQDCAWSQKRYVETTQQMAERLLVKQQAADEAEFRTSPDPAIASPLPDP